jgi:hypothetical protein
MLLFTETLITTGLLVYGVLSLKNLRVDMSVIGIKENENGPPTRPKDT